MTSCWFRVHSLVLGLQTDIHLERERERERESDIHTCMYMPIHLEREREREIMGGAGESTTDTRVGVF
jgi:hypothetical protein